MANSFFPNSPAQALAYLYMQNQDLRGKTPKELNTMFYEALFEIQRDNEEKQLSGWASKPQERG